MPSLVRLEWHRHGRAWVHGVLEGDDCELCDLAARWEREHLAAAEPDEPDEVPEPPEPEAARPTVPKPAPQARQLFLGGRRLS